MKLIHTLILALAALAAGLPQLEAAFPADATPYLKGATAILTLVVAVLATIDAPPSSRLARRL